MCWVEGEGLLCVHVCGGIWGGVCMYVMDRFVYRKNSLYAPCTERHTANRQIPTHRVHVCIFHTGPRMYIHSRTHTYPIPSPPRPAPSADLNSRRKSPSASPNYIHTSTHTYVHTYTSNSTARPAPRYCTRQAPRYTPPPILISCRRQRRLLCAAGQVHERRSLFREGEGSALLGEESPDRYVCTICM